MAKVANLTEWRAIIAYRADYKCERCGKAVTGKEGQAHHKMPRWFMPQLSLETDNGIYLCTNCHKQIHGGYGSIRDDEYSSTLLKEAISKGRYKCSTT